MSFHISIQDPQSFHLIQNKLLMYLLRLQYFHKIMAYFHEDITLILNLLIMFKTIFIYDLHKNEPIPDTVIWLSDQERKNAQKKLSAFLENDKLLAICVGDIRRHVKCWSADKFIKLLNNQNDKFSGVIFTGSDQDAERTEEVASKIKLPHINTVSSSLLETAAFLEKAIIYIGPDSGVGHIASAVKTPTISFFSVDKPERCRPWGKPVVCLEGAHNDARNISVESVNSAIQEILSE